MILLVDHDAEITVGEDRSPGPDRALLLQSRQLLRNEMPLVQQLPVTLIQLGEAE